MSFRQIKIRHIFILQFGGYFVKFYSRQIFRPYGILDASREHVRIPRWRTSRKLLLKVGNLVHYNYSIKFSSDPSYFAKEGWRLTRV